MTILRMKCLCTWLYIFRLFGDPDKSEICKKYFFTKYCTFTLPGSPLQMWKWKCLNKNVWPIIMPISLHIYILGLYIFHFGSYVAKTVISFTYLPKIITFTHL